MEETANGLILEEKRSKRASSMPAGDGIGSPEAGSILCPSRLLWTS